MRSGLCPRGERSRQRPLVDDLFTLDIRALRSNPISPAIWKEMCGCFAELRSAGYEPALSIFKAGSVQP